MPQCGQVGRDARASRSSAALERPFSFDVIVDFRAQILSLQGGEKVLLDFLACAWKKVLLSLLQNYMYSWITHPRLLTSPKVYFIVCVTSLGVISLEDSLLHLSFAKSQPWSCSLLVFLYCILRSRVVLLCFHPHLVSTFTNPSLYVVSLYRKFSPLGIYLLYLFIFNFFIFYIF